MSPTLTSMVLGACAPASDGPVIALDQTPADLMRNRPVWVATGAGSRLRFGREVVAGDVNGDGFDDIIVTAPAGSVPVVAARVYAYYGSDVGLPTEPDWVDPLETLPFTFDDIQISIADVNADGFDDLLVGYPPALNSEDVPVGALFQILGSASGLGTTATLISEGNAARRDFAQSIAGAGDVDGDGFDDVITSARLQDNGDETFAGAAFLFTGSPDGLREDAAWLLQGVHAFDFIGASMEAVGDVNADGFADIGVAVATGGMVFHGSPTGPSHSPAWVVPFHPDQANIAFGSLGDIDADGAADVWSVRANFIVPGVMLLYPGSLKGLATHHVARDDRHIIQTTFAGPAGDVNHDGHADIFISSPGPVPGGSEPGRVAVLLGPILDPLVEPTYLELVGPEPGAWFGAAVAFGDLDGDGSEEIIVGASRLGVFNEETGFEDPEAGGVFVYQVDL